MQTENKKEQYLEPVGFKGTKGALLQPKYNKGIVEIDNGKDTYWFAETYAPGIGEPSIKYANAKLISQSKELAKALQDMIEHEKENGLFDNHDFDGAHGCDTYQSKELKLLIQNAKQVLKEAGLTNE